MITALHFELGVLLLAAASVGFVVAWLLRGNQMRASISSLSSDADRWRRRLRALETTSRAPERARAQG